MFRTLFLAASLMALALPAYADCVDADGNDISMEPDTYVGMISKSESCYDATELARSCAMGSSMDNQTAGAAVEVCKAEIDKAGPSAEDKALLKKMEDRCVSRYENEDGTMYQSMMAYCVLEATAWMNGIVATSE